MPTEVARCADCGTSLKSVPTWLASVAVTFTCTSCPKRPSRTPARPELAAPAPVAVVEDIDADVNDDTIDELDEEIEIEIPGEEIEDTDEAPPVSALAE